VQIRIGCGKLSKSNLKNFAVKKISKKEIDAILWLMIRQDSLGVVHAVRYDEVCEDTHMTKPHYYNCITSLENKGFIEVLDKKSSKGWTIKVLDNNFVIGDDDHKGYVNINKDFLYSEEFMSLRANEKLLVLNLLPFMQKIMNTPFASLNNIQEQFDRVNAVYVSIEKQIKEWTGITNRQLISSYAETLKKFFSVAFKTERNRVNKSVYVFGVSRMDIFEKGLKPISYYYLRQEIIKLCLEHKIKYRSADVQADLDDLIKLINSYSDDGLPCLFELVNESFAKLGAIQPKNVHYLINTRISRLEQSA